MRASRLLPLVLLLLPLSGCKSIERLLRNSPFQEVESSADRVNLWPLYYRNGEAVAVLWPVYDEDEKGFALRPLITRDGSKWELLPPLCFWDTGTGGWVFLPMYSFDDSFGLFPLFGTGAINHVGPVWWDHGEDDALAKVGLFPVLSLGQGFNFVGPAWWKHTASEDGAPGSTSFGLFPLFGVSPRFTSFGPVGWVRGEDGGMRFLAALPLFGYRTGEDGSGSVLTPLGGRGWDAAGGTTFVNVLGPVFHYSKEAEGTDITVAWPVFNLHDDPRRKGFHVWPLFGRETRFDEKGEPSRYETTALAGLYRHASKDDLDALRILPLFSYRDEHGGHPLWYEALTLYGHKSYPDGTTALHVGTPLVFNYRGGEAGTRFSALLGTIDYESHGEESEFNLLYYLYRQRTVGTETRRDFFPFFTWDSGEKRSGFSFLWRLFDWQRNGDKVGGHVLFIPWGDR